MEPTEKWLENGIPPASFDRITCSLALHHIPDDQKSVALAEIHRVLRPDGVLILADFETSTSLLFWGQHRSRQTLEHWLSDGGFEPHYLARRCGVHVFTARPHPA